VPSVVQIRQFAQQGDLSEVVGLFSALSCVQLVTGTSGAVVFAQSKGL
jgi:hypothetical protein